jgi:hypothetical protein
VASGATKIVTAVENQADSSVGAMLCFVGGPPRKAIRSLKSMNHITPAGGTPSADTGALVSGSTGASEPAANHDPRAPLRLPLYQHIARALEDGPAHSASDTDKCPQLVALLQRLPSSGGFSTPITLNAATDAHRLEFSGSYFEDRDADDKSGGWRHFVVTVEADLRCGISAAVDLGGDDNDVLYDRISKAFEASLLEMVEA